MASEVPRLTGVCAGRGRGEWRGRGRAGRQVQLVGCPGFPAERGAGCPGLAAVEPAWRAGSRGGSWEPRAGGESPPFTAVSGSSPGQARWRSGRSGRLHIITGARVQSCLSCVPSPPPRPRSPPRGRQAALQHEARGLGRVYTSQRCTVTIAVPKRQQPLLTGRHCRPPRPWLRFLHGGLVLFWCPVRLPVPTPRVTAEGPPAFHRAASPAVNSCPLGFSAPGPCWPRTFWLKWTAGHI